MAAKKKTRKKQAKLKTLAGAKKRTPVKKLAKKKLAIERKSPKKWAKKMEARKSAALKTKSVGKKKNAAKTMSAPKKQLRKRNRARPTAFSRERLAAHSGGQSGDLQGLSRIEGANSESVDELLEEGNAFEADVVAGVENAGDSDEKEVRTHEVPEDDVPSEYLEK